MPRPPGRISDSFATLRDFTTPTSLFSPARFSVQLGFVSAILPELSLEDVLRFAAETGFDCVEVMCWPVGKAERRYAGVTHLDVAEFASSPTSAVAKVRQIVDSTGVQISALGYYPNPLTADETERAVAAGQLERIIRAAAGLGIGRVNTFIGRDPKLSVDENWPRLLEVWKPLVRLAEREGVKIGIENCPMLFTRDEWPGGKNIAVTPTIWRRLFADLGDQIGLNYDPSHMIWQQMDYLAPLREFKDRLFHVHAKDARVDKHRLDQVGILAHPLEYHSPKLPGLGDVNWGKFLSVLGDVGYDGPVCIEVEDRAYEKTLDLRKTALRQSGAYLRQFIGR
ncbi:MAG: sugar phosphate isomerase/epimerase [Pirellulales bacterium]